MWEFPWRAGVSAGWRDAPEGCWDPAGTNQAGTRSCSRPSGAQVVPSGPLPTSFPSPARGPYEPIQWQLHARPPRRFLLSPPRGGKCWGVGAPPALGQRSPGFIPAPAGTSCLYGREYRFARTDPPTRGRWVGGGQRCCSCLVSCGKPGSKHNGRVQRPGGPRRPRSIFCFFGGRAVGLTHGLKNTEAGTFRPIPRLTPRSQGSQGLLNGCLGAVFISPAGAGADHTSAPPRLHSATPTRGWVPSPPSCSFLYALPCIQLCECSKLISNTWVQVFRRSSKNSFWKMKENRKLGVTSSQPNCSPELTAVKCT